MKRDGDHNSLKLQKNETSASSIRESLKGKKSRKLKGVMPNFVYKDLPSKPFDFSKLLMAQLYKSSAEDLKEICDCTEGLENRIKALIKDNTDFAVAIEKISTKRYTHARIRRITVSNLLGITEKTLLKALQTELYCKILAVKESSKDIIPYLCENSSIPVLTRKKDYAEVKKFAVEVLKTDELANDLMNLVSGTKQNEYQMLIVKD